MFGKRVIGKEELVILNRLGRRTFMSIRDYETAIKLLEENQEMLDSIGGCKKHSLKRRKKDWDCLFQQHTVSFY